MQPRTTYKRKIAFIKYTVLGFVCFIVSYKLGDSAGNARAAPPGRNVRIYVYDDLPHHLQQPCLWDLTCLLHKKVRTSPLRTLDPSSADYFWVPHKYPVDNEADLRAILDFVTKERPWFQQSPVARTILSFSCDNGPTPCFWQKAPCATPSGLVQWPKEVNPAHPDRALMFLQLSGHADGGLGTCCWSCFQQGKDIVVPAMTPGRDWNYHETMEELIQTSPWLGGEAVARTFIETGVRTGAPPRDVSLFFAGGVHPSEPKYDISGRASAFYAVFGNRTAGGTVENWKGIGNISLFNSKLNKNTYPIETWVGRSVLCLDPLGTWGGHASRYISLLALGCIPLNTRPLAYALPLEEHESVNWNLFTVKWPIPHGDNYAKDFIAVLTNTVTLMGEARLQSLRYEAWRVYSRFLWTSVNPATHQLAAAIQTSAGAKLPDAWDTLVDILQGRLKTHAVGRQ